MLEKKLRQLFIFPSRNVHLDSISTSLSSMVYPSRAPIHILKLQYLTMTKTKEMLSFFIVKVIRSMHYSLKWGPFFDWYL